MRLVSGGIIVNYVCPSACKHCLYRSSPRRDKAYMRLQTLEPMLRKVKSLGCHSMHIGGGEPLLNEDALIAVLDCAASCGMAIDYIETNCAWHKTPAQTRHTLERLIDHGGQTIMVSIDPFHNEFVPFARVRAVMAVARQVKMGLFAWKMEFAPDVTQFDEAETHTLEEYSQRFGEEYIDGLPSRYGLNMNGRALDTFRDRLRKHPTEQIIAESNAPCPEMWQTSHFHIDLYGNYVFTSCVGLSLAVEDLGKPVEKAKYPYLAILHERGLAELFQEAKRQGFLAKPAYASKCDLCLYARTYLARLEPSSDLQPAEFYLRG